MDTTKEIENTVRKISKTREAFRKRVKEAIEESKAKRLNQTGESSPTP